MEKEITNQDLAKLIGDLAISNKDLTKRVDGLVVSNQEIVNRVGEITVSNKDLTKQVGEVTVSNKDLSKLIDTLAVSMAQGFDSVRSEALATKIELQEQINTVQGQLNDIQTDIRSFKKDTEVEEVKVHEILDDHTESIMHFDKRIETLETKVFV